MDEPASLQLPARLEEVRRLAEWVGRRAEQAGLDPDALIDLELALVEAANNVVLHGYAGGEGKILCRFEADSLGVTVHLHDWGLPIPGAKLDEATFPDLGQDHGRGLGILRACLDGLRYESRGGENRLTLVKRLAA